MVATFSLEILSVKSIKNFLINQLMNDIFAFLKIRTQRDLKQKKQNAQNHHMDPNEKSRIQILFF